MVTSFRIGSRAIGPGEPAFIIAEAGVNHNGKLENAHRLIDAAADASADAVKFQTWITERICAPGARKAEYQETNAPTDGDQFQMLKRLELPYEWHNELQAHAEQRGIVFLSTPDEIQSARFLCEIGVPALKIGSAELTNHIYLSQIAALAKPVILSTGMADMLMIERALKAIRAVADVPLALLHCVSAYPAQEAEMNLRCLLSMRERFKLPIGLSDHTCSPYAAIVSAGLGMAILEKHLTLDKGAAGPDHAASADPKEFSELVRLVRTAESMLGDGVKSSTTSEAATRSAVVRSICYARDLACGHSISAADLEALRFGTQGFGVEEATSIVGRRTTRDVLAGQLVKAGDLQ